MRKCPKCNAEITNDKAKYCKKCGTKLPPFEPQTNEKDEDVTRLVHEGIPLTGKQELPGSNTGGGMEVNPPTGPNSEPVVPTGEKPESYPILEVLVAIFFLVLFVGGLLLIKTAGHEESLEGDTDTAYVDTTDVDTCVVDPADLDTCAVDTCAVAFADDVEEISPEEENLTLLKEGIAEANSEFPMTAEEGIVVKKCYLDGDYVILKSATKPFNVLLACTRPLITELSYKLRQKRPLLPTTPPYPIMRLETIRSIIPISCRRHPKSVWNTSA